MKYLFSWLLVCLALPTHAQNAQVFAKSDLPTFYVNCTQEMFFILPEKLAGKSWTYSSDNGTVKLQTHRADFDILQIVPYKAGKGIITATSGTTTETAVFEVVKIPSPVAILADSLGREVNIMNPLSISKVKQVILQPDPFFAKVLPNEAKYEVESISATVFRGGKSVGNLQNRNQYFQFETLKDADGKKNIITPGDAVQVTVANVKRLTPQGTRESVYIKQPYMAFFVKE
ncbi:MAG: hypothetical protein EAY75_04595 [Bacteroidetes bacterium]|nr:MAG: hypothetical protein EAY75_04595 [Bacteroidota bacterium]